MIFMLPGEQPLHQNTGQLRPGARYWCVLPFQGSNN